MNHSLHQYFIECAGSFPFIILLCAFMEYLDSCGNTYRVAAAHVVVAAVLCMIPFFNVVLGAVGCIALAIAIIIWVSRVIDRWDTKGRIKNTWRWLDGLTLWPR